MILLKLIKGITIRYLDKFGYDIPDVHEYDKFRVMITDKNSTLLTVINHTYNIEFPIMEDYCKFKIVNKTTKIGELDICNNILSYTKDNFKYVYRRSNRVVDFYKTDISLIEEPIEDNYNKLRVFVVNDKSVLSHFGKNVNKHIEMMFRVVNKIFVDSGSKIEIKLESMFSLKENILNNNDTQVSKLENIKEVFEIVKFNNPNSLLSKSHLTIYLSMNNLASDTKEDRDNFIEGVTYFNSITTPDKAYSLIFIDDNLLYSAKKIAHEIGHSIGLKHDNNKDSIMNEVSKDDRNLKFFNKVSTGKINKFYRENIHLFKDSLINKDSLIETPKSAIKLINSMREDSFRKIVKDKLNGNLPDTTNTKYFLTISLIFYISAISLVIFLIK